MSILRKRKFFRRPPGSEPEFPVLHIARSYRAPLAPFQLPTVDTAQLRRRLRMSQTRFAHRFGFPVATLRHWERGNRKPGGASLALLHVIDYNPPVALRAIARAKGMRWRTG